jgi:hypothetical protein
MPAAVPDKGQSIEQQAPVLVGEATLETVEVSQDGTTASLTFGLSNSPSMDALGLELAHGRYTLRIQESDSGLSLRVESAREGEK